MSAVASPLAAFHPANALTYGSLVSGMGAMAAALHGHAGGAGALLALSVVFDTFDGRFARLFARTPEERAIGMQLDSLCDAIAFGAAPIVCVWMLWETAVPAALVYAGGAVTRLAFYNVTHEQREGFVGLPVPVAALICSTVLLLDPRAGGAAPLFVLIAAAMVLPLPIPRPKGLGFAAFVCWPVVVLAAHALSGL